MIPMSPMSAVVSMTAVSVMSGVRTMAVVTGVGRIMSVVRCGVQWVGDLSGLRRHRLPVGGLAPVSPAVGGVLLGGTASIWPGPAVPVMVLWRAHSFPSSTSFIHTPTGYPCWVQGGRVAFHS
ncbi:hypothetical protein SAMN05216184_12322 [Georgenia satyanarayanai]|uniref:Uncharacterized protein n=1 Tax=Georgenia satyanarayanai TaxID=860221 RepID=A0A2Y9ASX9_9MICO|nr:hypothetical protein A8987_12322 [Georgenia satyanarayanai]SSA47185.1 hypothetical protein SAMN05216184_12322 [Georgenia satyanarayanai]